MVRSGGGKTLNIRLGGGVEYEGADQGRLSEKRCYVKHVSINRKKGPK